MATQMNEEVGFEEFQSALERIAYFSDREVERFWSAAKSVRGTLPMTRSYMLKTVFTIKRNFWSADEAERQIRCQSTI